MSRIYGYKHNNLGFIECPSTYDFVYASKTRLLAIYELLDNIPESEDCFDGKVGDILVGGGNGDVSSPFFRTTLN